MLLSIYLCIYLSLCTYSFIYILAIPGALRALVGLQRAMTGCVLTLYSTIALYVYAYIYASVCVYDCILALSG